MCVTNADHQIICMRVRQGIMLDIRCEAVEAQDILDLLAAHLRDMHANSPACSVHALDYEALRGPDIQFFTARRDGRLLGCAALKELSSEHAEIKSMRVNETERGSGVAKALFETLIGQAKEDGKSALFLETGSQDFFAPARAFYAKNGFEECPPFYHYSLDPNSIFMTRTL